ncbi:hypothetical protein KY092_08345 [Natronomonas gomsonensis]|uniref:hypothetical protein n=1 Tax=Natronomonas gomsonensis TaxID=1046043 RepID=UPI0020CA7407|nr:hypothetical protein [Natronomonas gomsonensis]MCY4730567.1 hypothetical protein [Natronomonas gomsonensis]
MSNNSFQSPSDLGGHRQELAEKVVKALKEEGSLTTDSLRDYIIEELGNPYASQGSLHRTLGDVRETLVEKDWVETETVPSQSSRPAWEWKLGENPPPVDLENTE